MDERSLGAADRSGDLRSAIDTACWRDARRVAAQRFGAYVLTLDDDAVPLEAADDAARALAAQCGIDVGALALDRLLRDVRDALREGGATVDVPLAAVDGLHCAATCVPAGSARVYLLALRRAERDARSLHDMLALLDITLGVSLKSHFDLVAHQTLVEEQKAIIDHIGDGLMCSVEAASCVMRVPSRDGFSGSIRWPASGGRSRR